jgi:hypothetical protein
MASPKSFPLVRGRSMRATRLDGCCRPIGGPDSQIVTEGFVSVALTANVTDPEEITVTNANGQTCVRDSGCPEFNGYGVEVTFCEVNPCLFSMVTGQPSVTNAAGDVVGFRMNSDVSVCDLGFGLEVWMGVPGVACTGEGGAYGYLLLPCLRGGVIGDFTIENAAITFTVTGSSTKEGSGWGVGPYQVVLDENGDPSVLPDPLDPNDHLYAIYTELAPPEPTDGCVELELPGSVVIAAPVVTGPDADITWTASSLPACATASTSVNWGDGTPPETIASGILTASHTYTQVGTYNVIVAPLGGGCPASFTTVEITSLTP